MENRSLMSIALLALRVVLGVTMIAHGAQKVGFIPQPESPGRAVRAEAPFLPVQDPVQEEPGTEGPQGPRLAPEPQDEAPEEGAPLTVEPPPVEPPSGPIGHIEALADRWGEQHGFPRWLTFLAVAAELLGGLGLVLGLFGRLAAFGIAVVLVVAIGKVHITKGFFAPAGVELPLALFAMAMALLLVGMGEYSLDGKMARKMDKAIGEKDKAAPQPGPPSP